MTRIYITIPLLLICFCSCHSFAQKILRIHDLKSDKVADVKQGSYIQCYYQYDFNGKNAVFFDGLVRQVLDSTIVLRGRGVIPISYIDNIYKVPVAKRVIVPSIVLGLVLGGVNVLINPRGTQATTGAFILSGTALVIAYDLKLNRKQLKRNRVGETIRLEIAEYGR